MTDPSSAVPPLTTFPGKKAPPPPPPKGTTFFTTSTTTTMPSQQQQQQQTVNNGETRLRSGNIDHTATAYAHLMTAPKNNNANQNANAVATPLLPGAKKCILSESMMGHFKSLPAYKKLISFIGDLSISVLATNCRPVETWKYEGLTSAAVDEKKSSEGDDTNTHHEDAAIASTTPTTKTTFEVPRCDISVNRAKAQKQGNQDQYEYASPITPIFIDFFTELHTWVSEIPLETLMKSRFGNLAYRSFQKKLREAGPAWIEKIVLASPNLKQNDSNNNEDDANNNKQQQEQLIIESVCEELLPYLYDSFGNAVRIDYGTGHELHFLLILFVLHLNNLFVSPSEKGTQKETDVLKETVLVVLDEYWRLMSRLQQHYRLEPAGSHGVWGLDDFHHLPFIIGAAQFSPLESWQKDNLQGPSSLSSAALIPEAPLPSEIPSKTSCEEIAPKNFLFRAVLNIHRTKSGPFAEHSGVLHSVSGLASWPRVLTGMIKMFEGEVLGKFMIVQHLLFGKTFKWE